MEQRVELSRVYGDVYFQADRMPGNAYIIAQWFGVQSVETVMGGGTKLLEMMREKPFSKLVNSNEKVIGSWDMALEWAEKVWAPQMRAAGLKYLAMVVPTSVYATLSIENLIQRIDEEFEIRTFKDEAQARAWMESLPV